MLYRIPDFFSDLGGFTLTTFVLVSLLVKLINFQSMSNFLVSQLYRHKPSSSKAKSKNSLELAHKENTEGKVE